MLVQPYLSFNGRCEEAIQFYRKAVGAEVLAGPQSAICLWHDLH